MTALPRSLINAKEFYTTALSVDLEFIKALTNRAACQLAMEDAAGSIDDCSHALDLMSQGKPRQQALVRLPPSLSQSPVYEESGWSHCYIFVVVQLLEGLQRTSMEPWQIWKRRGLLCVAMMISKQREEHCMFEDRDGLDVAKILVYSCHILLDLLAASS